MANILGSLFIDLKANTADFISGMSAASYAAKRAGRDIEASFSRLGSAASAALAPFSQFGAELGMMLNQVGTAAGRAMTSFGKMGGALGAITAVGGGAGTAIAAVSAASIGLATHTAEGAAKLYNLSQATGVSTEALSGFQFVARSTGVEAESMTKGLEKLSKAAFAAATAPAGAVNAFTRLHISLRDTNGQIRPVEALFADVAERFANMPDGVVKTALAFQIFGRAGADLIPALNEGRAGIEEFLAQARELGIVLDRDTARAAELVHRQMIAISAAGDGLSLALMRKLLPALQTITKALVEGLKDNTGLQGLISGVAALTKLFLALGNTVWSVLRQIGVFVGNTIEYIASLASFAWTAIKELAKGSAADGAAILAAQRDWGTRRVALDKALSDDSKRIWEDNRKFVEGIYGKPILPPERIGRGGGPAADLAKEKAGSGTSVVDQANRLLAVLRAQTDAELALARATSESVAAQRLQQAAGEANEFIARLQATAENLQAEAARTTGAQHARLIAQYTELNALIGRETDSIQANTAVKRVAKDAVALVSSELSRATIANDNQIASLARLNSAYQTSLGAVAAAEIEKSLEGESEKVRDLGEEIDRLSKLHGVDSSALATLRGALDQANAALSAHREQLEEIRSLNYSVEISKATAALAGEQPYLDAINRAQLESADAIARATAALEAFRWLEEHPGASADQVAQIAANYDELARRQYDAQIAQEAGHYSLSRIQDEQIGKLRAVRAALQATGQSTLLVDAQIHDAQLQLAAQWDRAAFQVGTLREKFAAFFNELRLQGADLGAKVFGSFLRAIDDLETQIARLVVTGKAAWRELFESLAEEIVKAGLQKLFAEIGTRIATKLGISVPGMGKRGDSPGNPLYVHEVAAGALPGAGGAGEGGEGDEGGTVLGGIWSKISGSLGSLGNTISGIVSKIGSALAGIFSKIGSLFGGGLQGGGDVTPGRIYIVGEKHPEFFVPRQAGQVRTALDVSGRPQTTVLNFNVHGVQDYDSFKRSNAQIMTHLQNQLALSYSRNRA